MPAKIPAKIPTSWFIYALGSGWGHLNRALALAQVAATRRRVHLLTNSPYATRLTSLVQTPNLTLHQPCTQGLSAAEARQSIQSLLKSIQYDCLIVDTFPRGLIGELADLIPQQHHVSHVLIHRDLNPKYISAKAIAPFVRHHYNGFLLPGEPDVPLAHLPQAKITAPWISRDHNNLPDTQALRTRYNIPANKPLIVVVGAGQPKELAFFGTIAQHLARAFPESTIRCLSATCPPTCPADLWLYHWPGIDILQLANAVVGGGGYNLTHECAALNIPLVGFAFPRRYDRQTRRIQKYGCLVGNIGEAIATLEPLLQRPKLTTPSYSNGVLDAIAHIETWQSNP